MQSFKWFVSSGFLAAVMAVSLAGCSGGNGNGNTANNANSTNASASANANKRQEEEMGDRRQMGENMREKRMPGNSNDNMRRRDQDQ